MPIKNYTTTVKADKSIMEIQTALVKYEISEYYSGRYFAKGKTPEEAKQRAERELWERKLLSQDDMEIYINERCFKSINE